MKALVFLEHHGAQLQPGCLGVLAKAAGIAGGDVAAVLVGAAGPEGMVVEELVSQAGDFGAAGVHLAVDPAFEPALPQPRVDVLEQVVCQGGYDAVLFSNSVLAADVAAGLAARLGAGVNWDLVDLEERDGELVGRRLALEDSVAVEVGWRSGHRLALFRAGSFDPVPAGGGAPWVAEVAVELRRYSRAARVIEQRLVPSTGSSLESADLIVAGGMGLGSAEGFSLAEELAEVLGASVGASRAAVYAGWYPHSAQVGQTGKKVAPKLYVALGISGAVQHKVGMQRSKSVIAINKDPNAPIFELSDIAVVGDVHTIVPKLVDLLRERKHR